VYVSYHKIGYFCLKGTRMHSALPGPAERAYTVLPRTSWIKGHKDGREKREARKGKGARRQRRWKTGVRLQNAANANAVITFRPVFFRFHSAVSSTY